MVSLVTTFVTRDVGPALEEYEDTFQADRKFNLL
jgi:hypothetical protein